jgi:hypothetical protein
MMLTPILYSIDQPLLLCSFANSPMTIPCGQEGSSCAFEITGLFCALSQDEGEFRVLHFFWSIPKRGIVFLFLFCSLFAPFLGVTWPNVRIVTTDTSCKGHTVDGFDNQPFTMSYVAPSPLAFLFNVCSPGTDLRSPTGTMT